MQRFPQKVDTIDGHDIFYDGSRYYFEDPETGTKIYCTTRRDAESRLRHRLEEIRNRNTPGFGM